MIFYERTKIKSLKFNKNAILFHYQSYIWCIWYFLWHTCLAVLHQTLVNVHLSSFIVKLILKDVSQKALDTHYQDFILKNSVCLYSVLKCCCSGNHPRIESDSLTLVSCLFRLSHCLLLDSQPKIKTFVYEIS